MKSRVWFGGVISEGSLRTALGSPGFRPASRAYRNFTYLMRTNGENMKKIYQKPALLRREQLSRVTAGPLPSDFVPAPNGSGPIDE